MPYTAKNVHQRGKGKSTRAWYFGKVRAVSKCLKEARHKGKHQQHQHRAAKQNRSEAYKKIPNLLIQTFPVVLMINVSQYPFGVVWLVQFHFNDPVPKKYTKECVSEFMDGYSYKTRHYAGDTPEFVTGKFKKRQVQKAHDKPKHDDESNGENKLV